MHVGSSTQHRELHTAKGMQMNGNVYVLLHTAVAQSRTLTSHSIFIFAENRVFFSTISSFLA